MLVIWCGHCFDEDDDVLAEGRVELIKNLDKP